MKYSIILPYIDRLPQLTKTLESFVSLYGNRSDYEVVIVEDAKNVDSFGLSGVIAKFKEWINIVHLKYNGNTINPAPLFNYGVLNSYSEYVIISSPECYHNVDILKGLDFEFEQNKNAYVVCGCQSLNTNNNPVSWYQHSKYRNCLYHFCSALSRDKYNSFGGFDEAFGKGYCFDDDDFKATVIKAGLDVVPRDDLLVCHQWHSKANLVNRKKLWLINRSLYEQKHGKYIEPPLPAKINQERTMRIKKMISPVAAMLFLMSSCSMLTVTNTIRTETFLDEQGNPVRVVVTKEISDDGMYYEQAALAMAADKASCGDNCAPGEAGVIEMAKTMRMLMGKSFVEKGMNGVEAVSTIGGAIVSHSPYYMLGLGLYKALDRPSSVNMNGDNNNYIPNENHWTGNRINDDNTFTVPYRYQSDDITIDDDHSVNSDFIPTR